jgi:RHS repeat-associated protein
MHFTDQLLDPDGLTHFLFRDYSSTQGRWVVPDPAGMAAVDPGSPQSWNRYAYVLNNPLSYIDPLGLDCTLQDANTGSNNEQCGGGSGDASSSGNFGAGGAWGDGSPWNAWGGQGNYTVNGVPMDASMARAARNINPMFSDPGWQLFGTGDPVERSAGCYSNVVTDAESCPTFMDNRTLDPLPLPLTFHRVVTISAYHPTVRAVNPPVPRAKPGVVECIINPGDSLEAMAPNANEPGADPEFPSLIYANRSGRQQLNPEGDTVGAGIAVIMDYLLTAGSCLMGR